jgi:hypothetical protein
MADQMHVSRFCVRWYTIVIAAGRENDVAEASCCMASPPDLVSARRGEKSTGGFDEFTRCSPHQHADFTLAA